MFIVIVVLSIAAIVGFTIALFLGKEMMKKFNYMQQFIAANPRKLVEFTWMGGKNVLPCMRNIRLTSDKPFRALVGFHLSVPFIGSGFDYYGYVESRKIGECMYEAVVQTWMGKGKTQFQFVCTEENIKATCDFQDQLIKWVSAVYPPHPWQKFGFFA